MAIEKAELTPIIDEINLAIENLDEKISQLSVGSNEWFYAMKARLSVSDAIGTMTQWVYPHTRSTFTPL